MWRQTCSENRVSQIPERLAECVLAYLINISILFIVQNIVLHDDSKNQFQIEIKPYLEFRRRRTSSKASIGEEPSHFFHVWPPLFSLKG